MVVHNFLQISSGLMKTSCFYIIKHAWFSVRQEVLTAIANLTGLYLILHLRPMLRNMSRTFFKRGA